jgi:hypothetical protein
MNRVETLAEIRDYSAFALADSDLADCGSPDDRASSGAVLLTRTRNAFLEFIDANPEATADDIRDDVSTIVADMVSIYTHERWQQFVDLAAYSEEPEGGEWPTNLNEAATAALYQILERMVYAFAQMIEDAEEDTTNEDA